jgi:hypothetical protein
MRLTGCLLFVLFLSIKAMAQHAFIEGTVTDSLDGSKLSGAVVTLLRANDSILVGFVRTDSNGYFSFTMSAPPGNYLMMTGLSSYVEYVDTFAFTGQSRSFKIGLTSAAEILQAFVVHARVGAMRLKGDTVEFTADSFHVRPNATADELLKQLPGFQIDHQGKITVNGQEIEKMLVDGEEFFSDDPTLVSQIVRADMVDKVQYFDKKSEQAAFAGINDGKTQKTINLTLKENKKVGYFGKLGVGAGSYYYGNALYNRFNGPEKFTAYAFGSNTGDAGISWKDKNDFSVGTNIEYATPLQTLDGWGGEVSAYGFPNIQAAGAHYNNKWAAGDQSILGEIRAARLNTRESSTSDALLELPGERLSTSSAETDKHTLNHQKFNMGYKFKLDSFTEMSVNMAGNRSDKESSRISSSSTSNQRGQMINALNLNSQTSEKAGSFAGDVLIARRARKPGQLLTFDLAASSNTLHANGYFNSDDSLWGTDTADVAIDSSLHQYKQTNSNQHRFGADLMYTCTVSPKSNLTFEYSAAYTGVSSELSTFDQQAPGKYGPLDSAYSNNYVYNSDNQKGGVHYHLAEKHFQFDAGDDFGVVVMDQSDKFIGTQLKRTFTSWSPVAVIKYNARNGMVTSSLTYNGNTNLPSILQIQPLTNNSNPNNILIGNPFLKPSFSHSLRYNYINTNFQTQRTIWIDISYTFVSGEFSTSSEVDSFGRTITQWVNSDHSFLFHGVANYSFPITKVVGLGFIGGWDVHRSENIVNGEGNVSRDGSYTGGLSLSFRKPDKVDAAVSAYTGYHDNHSSVEQNYSVQYWAYNVRADGSVFLPLKSELHTNCVISLQQNTADFSGNANSVLWDWWLSRRLLKDESLVVKAAVMNVLNQGTVINRSLTTNYIAENRIDRIGRYFQLSATWSFNKFHGGK